MTIALVASLIILAIGWVGSALGLQYLLGVVLPLAAAVVFVVGFIWRVVYWAKSPVPFAIPTVGGQQKSLDWIKPARLDAPWTTAAVIGRMALEVLTFRSLFRNTNAERTTINGVPRITYYSSKWIWVFALLFHYSMLVIVLRHARFFLEPVPLWTTVLEFVDGVMQIGAPRFYMTDAFILLALVFLFARRLYSQKLRYITLPADWFALFLLIGVAGSASVCAISTKSTSRRPRCSSWAWPLCIPCRPRDWATSSSSTSPSSARCSPTSPFPSSCTWAGFSCPPRAT